MDVHVSLHVIWWSGIVLQVATANAGQTSRSKTAFANVDDIDSTTQCERRRQRTKIHISYVSFKIFQVNLETLHIYPFQTVSS
jgi:hypothetical protein